MALVPIKLIINLSKFIDSESQIFQGSPKDINDSAQKWTEALHAYMSAVSPPSPGLMTAANSAKVTMRMSILSALSSQTFNQQLPTILMTYVSTMSAGFAPNYIAIPPITPPVLAPHFIRAQNGGTAKEFIINLAMTIDAWMRTGTAALVTPTGVMPPIPWF